MMKSVFSWCGAAALGAVLLLTGCDKPKAKSETDKPKTEQGKNPAPAVQPQTGGHSAYGSAMENAKSTDCLLQMKSLRGFWAAEEYLPTSAADLPGAGSALKCPGSGADYEFLQKEKVRDTGKVPVLRCPTHDLTLYSDGNASSGR